MIATVLFFILTLAAYCGHPQPRHLKRCAGMALIVSVLFLPDLLAGAQGEAMLPGEIYRLRVENASYGEISVSLDGGQSWLLIGRVQKEAQQTAAERTASLPGVVLRSGGGGLAFSVGVQHVLKLRPAPSADRSRRRLPSFNKGPADILTHIAANTGPFGALAPSPNSPVALESEDHTLMAIPAGYTLNAADRFVILFRDTVPSNQTPDLLKSVQLHLADRRNQADREFHSLADAYAASAKARAKAAGIKVVSGKLILKASLPAGEPDPIEAVTYDVDNVMLAGQNVPPYQFEWDTRTAADGEHVVEIRALNHTGHLISHVRALVVVTNSPKISSTSR